MNDNLKDMRFLTIRSADMVLLHPSVRERFNSLNFALADGFRKGNSHTRFLAFETYRHPYRQNEAMANGIAREGAYRSPHQFGLAAQYAAFDNGRWSWHASCDWDYLKLEAEKLGLEYDHPGTITSPVWRDLKAAFNAM